MPDWLARQFEGVPRMRALLAAHKVVIEFCVSHRLRGSAEPLDPSENLDPDLEEELRAFAHVGKCLGTEEKVSQWLDSSPCLGSVSP